MCNIQSFWQSLLNRVSRVPAFKRVLRASVPAYQRDLRANVLACQRLVFTCQSAKWRANVSLSVCQTACQCFSLGCQRARRRADFLNIPLNETIHYYIKKFYIILGIICICIVHRNCIILISILMSYQRKVWNFSFLLLS